MCVKGKWGIKMKQKMFYLFVFHFKGKCFLDEN